MENFSIYEHENKEGFMKQKATYEQPKFEVLAFTSDAIRTSTPKDDHLIEDVEDWGLSEIGNNF